MSWVSAATARLSSMLPTMVVFIALGIIFQFPEWPYINTTLLLCMILLGTLVAFCFTFPEPTAEQEQRQREAEQRQKEVLCSSCGMWYEPTWTDVGPGSYCNLKANGCPNCRAGFEG